jgi:hypothetical protein
MKVKKFKILSHFWLHAKNWKRILVIFLYSEREREREEFGNYKTQKNQDWNLLKPKIYNNGLHNHVEI